MEETTIPISDEVVVTGMKKARKPYQKREETKVKKEEGFMTGEFEKFGENWIPTDEGDVIEGYVALSEDFQGEFGPVPRVLIGEKRVFCGAGLKDLPKLEGRYVRLTYLGQEKSKHKGRHDWRKFDVEVRKED